MQRNLLSSADVARMANVSPSAVSNWRARANKHFPEPAEMNKGRALFDYDAVANWLQANGIEFKDQRADQAAWTFLDRWRGDLEHTVALPMMLWAMCLRKAVSASSSRTRERTWRALASPETREGHRGLAATLVNAITAHRDPSEPLQVALRFPAGTGLDGDGDTGNAGDGSGLPAELTDAMLAELIRFVDGIDPESYASIADFMLERTIGLAWRASVDHGTTDSRSSRLLADLAWSFLTHAWEGREGEPGISVYDPACGIAQALLNFTESDIPANAGTSPVADRRIHMYVNDIDVDSLTMAARRLYLHGHAYPEAGGPMFAMDLARRNMLEDDPFPGKRMELVMVDPTLVSRQGLNPADPRWLYGRTSSDATLAWIEDAVAHLAEGGRALVITHTSPLFNDGAEQAIRKSLVSAGCVDAIVALPGGVRPDTAVRTYLWVLSAPDRTRESVLMVDASEDAPTRLDVDGAPEWMAGPLRALAAQAQGSPRGSRLTGVDAFSKEDSHPDGMIVARRVRAIDLLGSIDVSLRPMDWLRRADFDASAISREFVRDDGREAVVGDAIGDDSLLKRYDAEGFPFCSVPIVALGDMAMVSRGSFPDIRHRSEILPEEFTDDIVRDESAPDVIRWNDLMGKELRLVDKPVFERDSGEGGVPIESGRRGAGMASTSVTQRSRNAVTKPGDILLVDRHGKLHVAVDMVGGHRVERSVTVVRVDTARWDSEYVALMLCGDWNREPSKMSATTFGGVRPDLLEVPAVPLDQQRRIVEYAHAVETLERQAKVYRSRLGVLTKAARYGVSVKAGDAKEGDGHDAR